MMVELSTQQRDLLLQLVQREISDLGPEIRHTSLRTYREDLKEHRKALVSLSNQLQEIVNA